ncbi:hypothetical protein D8B29_14385 [Verminephrobacter eiseniae]|uniref:hypothetical protein n=1 Tax=Verminephrobacter eiseniae TaxID=364317 RepID=UPI0002F83EBB|nr:hypothetical protein [Verminephrobacter eiseniae]MCW5287008.1 hypothetical protein [Verminephrobacter eiseniae]MCW5305306.1 hypothetical protein [Verminephrobacter eiseniae]MCW8180744.1 hypothetical protein [Verminephrobacter eiseniae]MCW8189735.1 hypothetical protein [Verminephrobacter eiseniae]
MSRHRSDVAGCAQPSKRSARRIAQPIPSVLASDATPRCASMASADRQMVGDATLGAGRHHKGASRAGALAFAGRMPVIDPCPTPGPSFRCLQHRVLKSVQNGRKIINDCL